MWKNDSSKDASKKRKWGSYYNWDEVEFLRQWTKNPKNIFPAKSKKTPLLVLDEIHKARAWKRQLKGIFDTLEFPIDILVTGSARLNV